jgi:hypothetical protein
VAHWNRWQDAEGGKSKDRPSHEKGTREMFCVFHPSPAIVCCMEAGTEAGMSVSMGLIEASQVVQILLLRAFQYDASLSLLPCFVAWGCEAMSLRHAGQWWLPHVDGGKSEAANFATPHFLPPHLTPNPPSRCPLPSASSG